MLEAHEATRLHNAQAAAALALGRIGQPDEDKVTGDELALWPVVRDLRTRLDRLEGELEPGPLSPSSLDGVNLANRGFLSVGTGPDGANNFAYMDIGALAAPMSADEALVVAAWLVCLADPLNERFPAILASIGNL